jgi:L-malate glycosyltransferase
MTYKSSLIKKNIELILMWPILFIGKIAGLIFRLKTNHSIFMFFYNADVGGGIKVNADILYCIKEKKPLVIFCKKPKNNKYKHLFELEGVRIMYLDKYLDNKWIHFVNIFFRGVFASWINNTKKAIVFGGECIYFYKILPHLKKEVKTIELCHVNKWLNFTQAYIKSIDKRIFSTPQIKRDVETQYRTNKIPEIYYENLLFIDNKIEIPPYIENNNPLLEVVFIGRNSPQKRVYLIIEIAKRVYAQNKNIHFSFVGDLEEYAVTDMKNYCTFYGLVNDNKVIDSIYQKSDVLILTSAFEGLPIVVMEMMARGKVVLSTAVSGIPDYIIHEENGLLIFEKNEAKIIDTGVNLIIELAENDILRKKIEKNAYEFASQKFDATLFDNTYKNLFKTE